MPRGNKDSTMKTAADVLTGQAPKTFKRPPAFSASMHKDLYKDERFYPFPEKGSGKQFAFRDEEKLRVEYPKLVALYAPLWSGAGGGEAEGTSLLGELAGKDTEGITFNARADEAAKIACEN